MLLIGLRAIIGIFEAFVFSINNRMVISWFSEYERVFVVGFYTFG